MNTEQIDMFIGSMLESGDRVEKLCQKTINTESVTTP